MIQTPGVARLTPRRCLFLLLYLAFLFACLEVGARLASGSESLVWRLHCNDDAWWRLWWLQRHRADNPIMFSFDVYHPTRGWTLAPNLRGETLKTNSHGLRGVAEFPWQGSPGRKRILFLGDSFTFGEGVSDSETYCAQLARMLPECDILNLGVHGYGHDQMLIALQELGVKYHPDLVVVGFLGQDMERNRLAFRDFAKPRFRVRDGQLELTHSPVPNPQQVLAQARWESRLADLLDIVGTRLSTPPRHEERQLTAALLAAIVASARAVDARPILVYLPVEGELLDAREELSEFEQFLADQGYRLGVSTLQLRPLVAGERRRGRAVTARGHYTPAEHELIATALQPFLKELLGEEQP